MSVVMALDLLTSVSIIEKDPSVWRTITKIVFIRSVIELHHADSSPIPF